ncbi:MAG: hypothetical protein A2Y65_02325 [Deltaproteobacteria bacterium RBG_13_52_11]|nr:MAG: hypothetical protein A2Y65_02325 [Deltaproteobacteria bacterium RBG_13_52_11]
MIIAVMVLLILTVIGIYAITTSTFETKIAGSEREFKEAFYTADSGEPIGIELIKAIIHYVPATRNDLPAPWKDTGNIANDLFADSVQEIFTDGINDAAHDTDGDGRNDDNARDNPDIDAQGTLGIPSRVRLRADIDRLSSYQISGGATEYGSGYEGIGQGGGGDVAIVYEIDSLGRYTYTNAESGIEAGYRYVVGMPGGE